MSCSVAGWNSAGNWARATDPAPWERRSPILDPLRLRSLPTRMEPAGVGPDIAAASTRLELLELVELGGNKQRGWAGLLEREDEGEQQGKRAELLELRRAGQQKL